MAAELPTSEADVSVQQKLDDHTSQLAAITTLSVKNYGATGDGTTDDTAAIQAAIDSMTGGGVVFMPPGVYKVSDRIHMREGVRLIGAGSALTKIDRPHTDASMQGIGISNVNNVVIKGIELDGNFDLVGGTSNSGIFIYSAEDVLLEDVHSHDWGQYPISITHDSARVVCRNCVAEHGGDDAFSIGGSSHDVLLEGCIARDGKGLSTNLGSAFEVDDGSYNVVLRNCIGEDSLVGFECHDHALTNPPSGLGVHNVTFDGCIARNNSMHGFAATYDTWPLFGISIRNCQVYGSGRQGIYMKGVDDLAIDGCNVDQTGATGSDATTNTTGIMADLNHTTPRHYPRNVRITNNTVKNSVDESGIRVMAASDVFISGNYVTACGNCGIRVNPGESDIENIVITNNIIVDVGSMGLKVGIDIFGSPTKYMRNVLCQGNIVRDTRATKLTEYVYRVGDSTHLYENLRLYDQGMANLKIPQTHYYVLDGATNTEGLLQAFTFTVDAPAAGSTGACTIPGSTATRIGIPYLGSLVGISVVRSGTYAPTAGTLTVTAALTGTNTTLVAILDPAVSNAVATGRAQPRKHLLTPTAYAGINWATSADWNGGGPYTVTLFVEV